VVSTFCFGVGGTKPRADRRAGRRMNECSRTRFRDVSSVRTPVMSVRLWLQLRSGSNAPIPYFVHSFLCYYLTASDCWTSFKKFGFAYYNHIASEYYRSCLIRVYLLKPGHNILLVCGIIFVSCLIL
jgi:hypothetical protein